MIKTEVVILAALLHDLGKVWLRAGTAGNHADLSIKLIEEIKDLFSDEWLDGIKDAVRNHHQPTVHKEIEKIVQIADRLASTDKNEISTQQQAAADNVLVPVSSQVELIFPKQLERWGFNCGNVLSLDKDTIFPCRDVVITSQHYSDLWQKFKNEIEILKANGYIIKETDQIITLISLIRKYFSFVPSTTSIEEKQDYIGQLDISLYDNLKVTAAIAACLNNLSEDDLESLHQNKEGSDEMPVAMMLRADISGIQNFIYRITRPTRDGEHKGTAKRLRGRSFYLSLINDVIADWYIRELDLSVANILFCGGGRFDLLVPIDHATQAELLPELEKKVQQWLKEKFLGTISIQIAKQLVRAKDFADLKEVYNALDDSLADRKLQKFHKFLNGDYPTKGDFYFLNNNSYHACNVCEITPLADPGTCDDCEEHLHIGQKLPSANYLVYLNAKAPKNLPGRCISFDEFDTKAYLINEDEIKKFLNKIENQSFNAVLYKLNETDFLIDNANSNMAFGFKFLAQEAPVAKVDLHPELGNESTRSGDVLDFEDIADMSKGAKRLGVLKADVDYLGSIFGLGIKPRSIARISTLSNTIDLFFSGWLNKMCRDLAENWHNNANNDNPLKGKVDGLFYIVYSGGDDLLVIGPWDQVVEFSSKLHDDFQDYVCKNPNVAISAAILLVKPLFPIQRFSKIVGGWLEKSKEPDSITKEKNNITLFKQTVKWQNKSFSFFELLKFGRLLARWVDDKKVPRTFVHFLIKLHEQYFIGRTQSLMWIPKLHYVARRRLSKEVINDPDFSAFLNNPEMMRRIRIPASYVSLITRKE